MLVYVIGSLRNPVVREVSAYLRTCGMEVFDDWHGAGERADEEWQAYEEQRGRRYTAALKAPLAQHNFSLDKHWLDKADAGVLVMPAGKSAHLELGYLIGQGKRTVILLDEEPKKWDLMYNLADHVVDSLFDLRTVLH